MPKHFFPSHVVDAVAEALWRTTDGSFVMEWGDISEDVGDHQYTKAHIALKALCDVYWDEVISDQVEKWQHLLVWLHEQGD